MRNPAIHIRRSDLIKAFKEWGLDATESEVNDLFKFALKYSIRNRVQVISKSTSKKKIERYVEASTNLISDFNRVYQGVIIANNIKAMAINKGSVQYLTLTEVTNQAIEFCQLFDLGYETGFKLFVETGLTLLKNKFSIYRLKGTASRIVEYYRDKKTVEGDLNPEGTDIMEVAWHTAVRTYFNKGIYIESDVRVHFIYARLDADLMKADYYDWMYAQFEKWSYLNSIPAFTQLYGDNAKLVYQMYMAKVTKTTASKEERDYFNKLPNGKKKDIPTEASVNQERAREARLQSSIQRTGSEDDGAGGAD